MKDWGIGKQTAVRTITCNTEFSEKERESLKKLESLVGFGLSLAQLALSLCCLYSGA